MAARRGQWENYGLRGLNGLGGKGFQNKKQRIKRIILWGQLKGGQGLEEIFSTGEQGVGSPLVATET